MGFSREAARYVGAGWKLRELGHQVPGRFRSQEWKNEKSPQVPKYLDLQLSLTGHPEVSIRDERGVPSVQIAWNHIEVPLDVCLFVFSRNY